MTKRSYMLALLAGAAIMAVAAWGCGGSSDAQKNADNAQSLLNQINNSDTGSLDQRIQDLKNTEMTVEIVEDGKTTTSWTQKNGSWRYDDPNDKTSYVIFNKNKGKTWAVTGNSAVETDNPQDASYDAFNPAFMLSAFAYLPKTGGSDDTWEFGIPGQGKVTIEFKGPQGLPTKMINEDASGKTSTTEFRYTNVGSVPDSTFELPAGVQVTNIGTATTGGFTPSAIPTIPDYSPGQ